MIIGYARVSTTEQNLDRQILALEEAGCETIYQEKMSGTKKDRAELQKMLGSLHAGDTVIVKELTRISRSTSDLLELVQHIADKGAYIKSLNESWLDTSTPAGELMLTIFAGMAQFERKLMLQRCQEGRAVAMAKGVRMGRPKVMDKQMEYAIQLYKNGELSIRTICDVTGVAKATFCRRLKELKIQKGQDKNKVKITA